MSNLLRLTSVANLSTSAKTVDDTYNVEDSEYRIVSADGVLFCVPSHILVQIDALWDMVGVMEDCTAASDVGEIPLTDDEFEYANALRCLFDLLSGDDTKLLDWWLNSTTIVLWMDTLKLADKYGAKEATSKLKEYLERFYHPRHGKIDFLPVFEFAARMDDEDIATIAAAWLVESGAVSNWQERLSPTTIRDVPLAYVWALALTATSSDIYHQNLRISAQNFKTSLRQVKSKTKAAQAA